MHDVSCLAWIVLEWRLYCLLGMVEWFRVSVGVVVFTEQAEIARVVS